MGFLRMAIKTTLEQLKAVQAAIALCETGQEGSVNGKRYRMADLDVLYKQKARVLARKGDTVTGAGCHGGESGGRPAMFRVTALLPTST